MPPKSNARKSKKADQDADSDGSNSNNSVSFKPTNNKQPCMRPGDTSASTTNEPSSASAVTVSTSTVTARHPTSQAGLPTFAAATAAAAPTVPTARQKPRRAGFREQFLQKLRVMLDRESQHDDTTILWSADGNSFIINDQARFEEETIPAYFGNPIVFASFLRKLQRWGFNRMSSRRSGRYEFGSPTFKRMDARSAPAAAAAATTNTAGNDSIQVPQQQQQQQQQQTTQAWPVLQQVMAQFNQPPAHNHLPSADPNTIADLISTIFQHSTQQPSTSSQQPDPNQMNIANAFSMLQNAIGSNQQQPVMSQTAVPSQPPVPNHASQLNNVAGNNHLQSFQQWQHPNPTMNMLNNILHHLDGGPTSSAQVMGHSPPSNAVHALMSLSGMLQQQPSLPNTTPAMSQSNNTEPVISLLQVLHRFVEDEHQRRAQVDALHHVIIATIGHIVGRNNPDEADGQREASGQRIGRSGEATAQNIHLRNPTGMTVRVPYNNTAQSQQAVGAPPPPSAGHNIQADSIAAILQAALRGDAAAPPPQDTTRAQNNGPVTNNVNEDDNGEGEVDTALSPRKRKSSDNYDVDDDKWNKRLRKRRKSPP